ncbi:hypothetical protein SSX86_001323 [Deinandra increscens subsp. villosa]|uniref:BLOC-1-related complex subunit 6 C-terminal helix domain-containing protein n=1 Tax=Deinandra increscens subsp. villosa TaxID=3103831 RepID=A0AAP0HEF1_9ASTR
MESKEATNSETLDHNHQNSHEEEDHQSNEANSDPSNTKTESSLLSSSSSSISQEEILKAVEVVERNSVAISESFSSLFASLRVALSEVTSSSVDHVQCFNDAAGRLQESALDSATKGNLYINSCLRLNEEMRGIDTLAMQLKVLRRNVDALDTAVNSVVRLH